MSAASPTRSRGSSACPCCGLSPPSEKFRTRSVMASARRSTCSKQITFWSWMNVVRSIRGSVIVAGVVVAGSMPASKQFPCGFGVQGPFAGSEMSSLKQRRLFRSGSRIWTRIGLWRDQGCFTRAGIILILWYAVKVLIFYPSLRGTECEQRARLISDDRLY